MSIVAVAGLGLRLDAVDVDDDVGEVGGLPAALLDDARPCRVTVPARRSEAQDRGRPSRRAQRRTRMRGSLPSGPGASVAPPPIIAPPMIPLRRRLLAGRRRSTAQAAPRATPRAGRARAASLGLAARRRPPPQYVAAQFREAGLAEVRLQEFESHGRPRRQRGRRAARAGPRVRRGRRPPRHRARGARRLRRRRRRGRADRGGARRWRGDSRARARSCSPRSTARRPGRRGRARPPGSRAYVKRARRRRARRWSRRSSSRCAAGRAARPSLQPIAYADPLRPGGAVDRARAGSCARALAGARGRGRAVRRRRPVVSWLYQPGVRMFRVDFYGDDLSFLQAGLPALFASDSSFSRLLSLVPPAHATRPTSSTPRRWRGWARRCGARWRRSAWRLAARPPSPRGSRPSAGARHDAARRARALLSPARPRSSAIDTGPRPSRSRGPGRGLRRPALAAPVPALWVFLLPNLLPRFQVGPARRWWAALAAMAPALSLVVFGVVAWRRDFIGGSFVAPWELGLALSALGLLLVGRRGAPPPKFKKTKRPSQRPSR